MTYNLIDTITQGRSLAHIEWASELQEHRVSILQGGALIAEYFMPGREDAYGTALAELACIASHSARIADDYVMHFMSWYREMRNATPAQALTHLFPEDFQP